MVLQVARLAKRAKLWFIKDLLQEPDPRMGRALFVCGVLMFIAWIAYQPFVLDRYHPLDTSWIVSGIAWGGAGIVDLIPAHRRWLLIGARLVMWCVLVVCAAWFGWILWVWATRMVGQL